MVGVFRMVSYVFPRSLCRPAVVLLPGVNLYPVLLFSVLSFLGVLLWLRACLWWVWVCSFPPSVVWPVVSVSLLAPCVSVFVLALVAPLFVLVCLGCSRAFGWPGCGFCCFSCFTLLVSSLFALFSVSFGTFLRFCGNLWAPWRVTC